MPVNLIILIGGVTANILLGLFVFVRNRRSATVILFFLLTLDIGLWSIANYMTLTTKDLLTVLYWTRGVMALAIPQAVLFFLLIRTLPSMKFQAYSGWWTGYLIASVIAAGLCVSPYLFPSIIFVNNTPSPTPGPAMPLFVVVAMGSVLAAMVTLVRRIKREKGIVRSQLQVIGFGIAVMFTLIIFFNFILVIAFQQSSFISFSPLYTLPFVIATAYAIIKHKFLTIRIVIARAVSYVTLISLFGIAYALLFSSTASLLVSPYIDPQFITISTFISLVMLLTFPSVKRGIEKATDAVFFKNKYDTPQVLYRLAKTMARSLRLEDLCHQFLRQLMTEVKVKKACIVLIYRGRIFSVLSEGYELSPELHESIAEHVVAVGGVHYREDEHEDQRILEVFEALDVSLVISLETSEKAIGLLCVGERLSGEEYTEDDIHLLEIIAPELGVAIENALSYEEIRRFTMTLEKEIADATEDLRGANEKLLQLDKLKDEFVSLASHELRTPLTSIRSYLWMALSGKGGEVSEKQQYYLDRAFTSADRLIRLVNDMLNISRIESGRIAVQFSRVEVSRMIREVIAEVQPRIEEQGIIVHMYEPSRALPDVIADTDKIKEVLINYVGNAIKFTPRGGSISIDARVLGDYVEISVHDTGLGFQSDESEKLFQKFSTLNSGSRIQSAQYQSTGLGLYISKSIVSLHGGQVRAMSDGPHKGSTFYFTLPLYTPTKRDELQRKYALDGLGIIHNALITTR